MRSHFSLASPRATPRLAASFLVCVVDPAARSLLASSLALPHSTYVSTPLLAALASASFVAARSEWLFFRAVFSVVVVVVVVVWRRCAWREVFVVDGVCSWWWWWRVWQLIDRWSLAFALSLPLSRACVCD